MLNIAFCDNDVSHLKQFGEYFNAFRGSCPETELSAEYFSDPYRLVESLEKGNTFQIYLLDILMPSMNGICLADEIRSHSEDALIIFISSSPDFALDSFHVYPFQYLVKPVSRDDFFEVIGRGIKRCGSRPAKSITFKTPEGITTLPFHSIEYIEYRNHVLYFYKTDRTMIASIHIRIPFDQAVASLLEDERFLHPHKSYLVNLDSVRKYTLKEFVLSTGAQIPISQKCSRDVKQAYFRYLAGHSRPINLPMG